VNIQGVENGFLQLTNKHDTLFIVYQSSEGETEEPTPSNSTCQVTFSGKIIAVQFIL
jgi:hypothetical protein